MPGDDWVEDEEAAAPAAVVEMNTEVGILDVHVAVWISAVAYM